MAADAHVFVQPLVSIAGTDFACYATRVALMSEDKMADAETFCSPGLEIPTTPTWSFEIEMKMAYGTAETDEPWNTLIAIARTKVAWIIRPETGVIGVTNPQADFNAYVPTPDFIDASVGETMSFTLSGTTVGAPVFTTS